MRQMKPVLLFNAVAVIANPSKSSVAKSETQVLQLLGRIMRR